MCPQHVQAWEAPKGNYEHQALRNRQSQATESNERARVRQGPCQWRIAPQHAIAQTLGYDVVEAESGRVVITLDPTGAHLNPWGTVHGGLTATLLDSCMGLAVQSTGQIRAEGKVRSSCWHRRTPRHRHQGPIARPRYNDVPNFSRLRGSPEGGTTAKKAKSGGHFRERQQRWRGLRAVFVCSWKGARVPIRAISIGFPTLRRTILPTLAGTGCASI